MDSPSAPKKLAGRYEVRQILGQGGMGLVYRAYDAVVRREVALKTILDIPDPAATKSWTPSSITFRPWRPN